MSCCDETTARVPDTDVSRRSLFKGAALIASVISAARPTRSEAQGKQIKLAYCSQLLCGVPYEVARSRVLVERSAYDRFLELLVESTGKVVVGDPEDDATEMGPLVSAAHRELVASFVEGEPLFRGAVPDGPGFWYPCTLVEAANEDRIAREEVFGPVAAVIPFEDEADAIRIANDTPYGLSGSIWTRDGARALRVARALETGVLSVNSNSSVRVQTPFGGFKQSGFGRELGMQALDGYSEVKSVFLSTEV